MTTERSFFRALSLALAGALCLAGCQKRERLSVPTQTLRISPTAAAVRTGDTKSFSVSVVSPSGEALDVLPSWSISPASVGNLSPSTGLLSQFTAGQSLGTQGVITVSYEGLTAQAQVMVVPETGDPSTDYGIYTESLTSGMLFGVANPPNPDGASIGANGGNGGSMALSAATTAGTFTEGTQGLRGTAAGTGATSYAFFYFSFGAAPDADGVSKNLSAYAGGTLKFDVRVPAARTVHVALESLGGPPYELDLSNHVFFDDVMHSVSIPLTSFATVNMAQFEGMSVVALNIGNTSYDIYIDNIRIELP